MSEENRVTVIGYIDPDEIALDPFNLNLGTEDGMNRLDQSLERYGAVRPIAVDRNNVDIAGNKTLEQWVKRGGRVFVVETEGDVLLAHRRTDMDINEPRTQEAAIADNAVAEKNLNWDVAKIAERAREGLDMTVSFSKVQIEDFLTRVDVPSLDAITQQYGEPMASDLFNPLRLLLPQEMIDRYHDLVEGIDGDDSAKFGALLEWAAAGQLATSSDGY